MPAANPFQVIGLLSLTYCFHFVLILNLLIWGTFSENEVYKRKEITYLLLQMSMFLISSISSISSQVIHCQASSPEPLGHAREDFCGRTVTPHKACCALLPLLQWKWLDFSLLVLACSISAETILFHRLSLERALSKSF